MRTFRIVMLVFVSCVFLPQGTQAQAMPPVGPDWILAHIDIETTGLIPGYHELVDIGIVYTDLDGNVLEKFYRKIMPEHLDRVDPGAVRVNGFNPEVWHERGAVSAGEALHALLRFEREHFSERKILRVAYNSKFDAAFLDHLYRSHGEEFDQPNYSYFWLDIPSMAWVLDYRQLRLTELAEALDVEPSPSSPLEHTGLADAEANVRIYRALLATAKKKH